MTSVLCLGDEGSGDEGVVSIGGVAASITAASEDANTGGGLGGEGDLGGERGNTTACVESLFSGEFEFAGGDAEAGACDCCCCSMLGIGMGVDGDGMVACAPVSRRSRGGEGKVALRAALRERVLLALVFVSLSLLF